MNIGYIGYGEAAYNISLGLGMAGISGQRAYDTLARHEVMGPQVVSRAGEAGVALEGSGAAVAKFADLVFVAVPSSFALEVALELKPHLRPGQLYVDVSASTPSTKEAIWDAIRLTGVLFADAAMLGSLPKDKHQVPITASGNGAQAFYDLMTPYGMNIQVAGGRAGAASAIKLVRSIFMKGIATLMIETLQAGDAYGIAGEVVSSIGESMDGIAFADHLDRLVTGTAIHCARRGAELKGSIQMLEEAGLRSDMTQASKQRMQALEPYGFPEKYAGKKPAGWQEIITALRV